MSEDPRERRKNVITAKAARVLDFKNAYGELISSVSCPYGRNVTVSIEQYFESLMFAVSSAAKAIPSEKLGVYLGEMATYISKFVCNEMYLRDDSQTRQEYLAHARRFACHMRKIMEVRDKAYNGGNALVSNVVHSDNVGAYARRIALELKLSADDVEEVEIAGILHDIGKIGVPDKIISKQGPLSDDERKIISPHPEYSARIVQSAGFNDIADLVLTHHIRHDGKGYPESAVSRRCPSKPLYYILPIADTFDAVSHGRPYKQGLGPEGAMEVLKNVSGSQLSPLIVGLAVSRGFLVDEFIKRHAA